MKKFLIAFAVFLIWSFFGLWLYTWVYSTESTTAELNTNKISIIDTKNNPILDTVSATSEVEQKIKAAETDSGEDINTFSNLWIRDSKNHILFAYPEPLYATENTSVITIPETVSDFKEDIKKHLQQHPGEELQIISKYSPNEIITTPNIGIQRGEKMREVLKNHGISEKKIAVKSVLSSMERTEEGLYKNSVEFVFKPLDLSRIENLKTTPSLPEKTVIYPTYATTGIVLNEDLNKAITQLKEVLKNNPDLQIEVVGHTDNVGNATDNYKAGLTAANQVRWLLIKKTGIFPSKIKALSKGEAVPLVDNTSKNNRNINRRIELVYSK